VVGEEDDFESGDLGPQWTTLSSDPAGRIQVTGDFGTATGDFALLMDRNVSGAPVLNEAIWTVDLSGRGDATLVFSHADFNDEENLLPADYVGSASGDGVSISDDGSSWHTVLNATSVTPGVWAEVIIDLGAEAAAAGMSLGPDFRIKFQQFDNLPLTTDGRGYDDISIEVPGDDVDRFEITIDPGQTITVLLEPEASLQGSVELADAGEVLASGAAGSGGESVLLQTVPTVGRLAGQGPQPRPYTISVAGVAGSGGGYTLRVILNAALEEESPGDRSNDDLATAQDLADSFIPLLRAVDANSSGPQPDRGAVLGTVDAAGGIPVDGDDFESGALGPGWSTSSSDPAGRIQITGDFGIAAGAFALLMDRIPSGSPTLNEAIWTVDLSGLDEVELVFSHADFNDEENPLPGSFVGSAFGDGVAISDDGSSWHTVLNATPVGGGIWQQVVVDLAGAAATAGISLGPDFRIKFQQFDDFPLTTDGRGYDEIQLRIPTDPGDLYAFSLEAGESLTLVLVARGAGDVAVELLDDEGRVLAGGEVPGLGGIVNRSFEIGNFTGWDASVVGVPFQPWSVSPAGFGAGFGMLPTDPQEGNFVAWNGFDGAGPTSFRLTQDVEVPLDPEFAVLSWRERIQWNFTLGGFASLPRTHHVEILDPGSEALLATLFSFATGDQSTSPTGNTGWQLRSGDLADFAGQTVRLRFRQEIPQIFTGPAQLEIDDLRFGPPPDQLPQNVDDLITGFEADRTGTYHARVRGDAGTPYSLILLRNAQFDLEANDAVDAAQLVDAPQVAGRRWILGHASGQTLYGASRNGELFTIDPSSGAGSFVGLLPSTSTEIEISPAELGFSQFPDGAFRGQAFDPDTAAAIGGSVFNGASFTGLEWRDGRLFGASITGPGSVSSLQILDPVSGGSSRIGATGVGPIAGLALDPVADVLYGIAGGPGPAELYRVDPTTGVATPIGSTGFQAGSLEFGADGRLFAGGTGANGGQLYVVDPASGSSTLVGMTGFSTVTGLALRGGLGDFYAVELGRNEPLHLRTYTPAGKSGEFVNQFDPMLKLYYLSGVLVASDDDSAPDGRNAQLVFTAGQEGVYVVEVSSSEANLAADGGEYILSIR
jgi:hypothetical protein